MAPQLEFAEIPEGFNDWIISIGFVFCDAFSQYVMTKPIQESNAKTIDIALIILGHNLLL